MPDIVIEQPVVETPVAPPLPADDASLADHAKAFHAGRDDAQEPVQSPKRHRAPKDVARPEDVPRIRELSGKVKQAETERDEWKTKYEQATKPAVTVPAPAPIPAVSTFTTPEPKIEDFATADDPYLALARAAAKWDRDKERFEDQQQATQAQTTAAQQAEATQQQATHAAQLAAFTAQVAPFIAAHPDYPALVDAMKDEQPPPVLQAAILADDNGPSIVYHLAQHPEDRLTIHLLTDAKPVSAAAVASTTQWLRTRMQTGPTGAVTSAHIHPPAPRPPTPVRTTPMPPTDDPPGDTSSLRDHGAFFHKPSR